MFASRTLARSWKPVWIQRNQARNWLARIGFQLRFLQARQCVLRAGDRHANFAPFLTCLAVLCRPEYQEQERRSRVLAYIHLGSRREWRALGARVRFLLVRIMFFRVCEPRIGGDRVCDHRLVRKRLMIGRSVEPGPAGLRRAVFGRGMDATRLPLSVVFVGDQVGRV